MATVVQTQAHGSNATIDSVGATLTFGSSVQTGSTIVVLVAISATGTTIGASDATNGAYTVAQLRNPGARAACVLYKHNVTGGFTQVTITSSVSGTGRAAIVEFTGADAGTPTTGFYSTASTSEDHYCSTLGVTGSGFVGAASAGGNGSDWSPDAPFTALTSTTANQRRLYYRTGSSSAERAHYTTTGTLQNSDGAMALFPDASGSPPGSISDLDATAVSSTQVNLTWTPASGATSHRIERATVG